MFSTSTQAIANMVLTTRDVSCSGYGSPSEDFELSEAPVAKTVTGNEPEQVALQQPVLWLVGCAIRAAPPLGLQPEACLGSSRLTRERPQCWRHALGTSQVHLILLRWCLH